MPTPEDGPWFRSYLFAFWVIPVHLKGWLLLASMLFSTFLLSHLMLDVFEDGSIGRYACSAIFLMIAGGGLTLAYTRTEKHKG
jgi:hypothetical protein